MWLDMKITTVQICLCACKVTKQVPESDAGDKILYMMYYWCRLITMFFQCCFHFQVTRASGASA